MRNWFAALILVLAWCLCAPPAGAQGSLVLRLTLDEALARARVTSHRLAEARARQAGAEAAVSASETADQPTLSAQAGYTRTNHVVEFSVPSPAGPPRVLYPDVPNNYYSRLELQWPIYSGGRSGALERAARAEASAVEAEVAVAQADLRLEVTRAFWALVTARATVDVLEGGVTRAQAHLADVRQRRGAGLVPPNEVASAEAQESRARMLAIEATNLRDVAMADLGRLVGVDAAQPIEPAEDLENPGATSRAVEGLLVEAQAARQERRALLLRIESATDRRAGAAAGRRPQVGLSGGVDYARPNPRIFPRADQWNESWDAGLHVRWSLWDGGRVTAELAQASAVVEAGRQRLAEFDSVLALEVRQRTLEIASGRAAIEAATDAVRAATEARRVVEERYQAGVIAQGEVRDAEFALVQAQLDETRAGAAMHLAEARLARAVGR
jgi:outer membrane protein TolC